MECFENPSIWFGYASSLKENLGGKSLNVLRIGGFSLKGRVSVLGWRYGCHSCQMHPRHRSLVFPCSCKLYFSDSCGLYFAARLRGRFMQLSQNLPIEIFSIHQKNATEEIWVTRIIAPNKVTIILAMWEETLHQWITFLCFSAGSRYCFRCSAGPRYCSPVSQ